MTSDTPARSGPRTRHPLRRLGHRGVQADRGRGAHRGERRYRDRDHPRARGGARCPV